MKDTTRFVLKTLFYFVTRSFFATSVAALTPVAPTIDTTVAAASAIAMTFFFIVCPPFKIKIISFLLVCMLLKFYFRNTF